MVRGKVLPSLVGPRASRVHPRRCSEEFLKSGREAAEKLWSNPCFCLVTRRWDGVCTFLRATATLCRRLQGEACLAISLRIISLWNSILAPLSSSMASAKEHPWTRSGLLAAAAVGLETWVTRIGRYAVGPCISPPPHCMFCMSMMGWREERTSEQSRPSMISSIDLGGDWRKRAVRGGVGSGDRTWVRDSQEETSRSYQ